MSGSDGRDHRIRRAIEESAREEEDVRGRQRNAALAILVLAILVVGLLVFMVFGGIPGFPRG
jgi:hypothetical protein